MTRVAVVANPTKSGDPYWSRRLIGVLDRAGLPDACWLATTAEDPGPGQARRALADGAELVVVAGGDGTVRAVGTVLAGTGVPMALLPSGTGNLLARNLGIPLEVDAAAWVASSGRTAALDVGRASDGECFLVMAGTGFDAAMLRDTSDRAKVWLSWAAYVAAGLRHLRGPLATYDLQIDEVAVRRQGRGVLVGNVAELQSGLELLHGARPDDGLLDVAVLGPRTLREWLRLARQVAIGRAPGEHVLERWTGRSVSVTSSPAQPVAVRRRPGRVRRRAAMPGRAGGAAGAGARQILSCVLAPPSDQRHERMPRKPGPRSATGTNANPGWIALNGVVVSTLSSRPSTRARAFRDGRRVG